MKKHYRHETDCLNCGTELQGHFCHVCGQENLEMKESFGHMLNHAISDYFHFDYQFFHTLKPLFAKPGKLTVDYLAGRRMQYLHPVKMYIFISLVFFVLFFQLNGTNGVYITEGKENGVHQLKDTIKTSLLTDIDNDSSLSPEEKKRAKAVVAPYLPASSQKADTAKHKTGKPELNKDEDSGDEGNFTTYLGDKDAKNYDEYLANQSKLASAERDGFFTSYLKKKSFDWKNHGKNAQEILIESIKHNLPKVMFVILPLFALILKVAFRRNHKLYVEHIIYSIHLHCFLFLFLTLTLLIQAVMPNSIEKAVGDWLQLVTLGVFAWYIYRSLRVVYQRSRWRTVSKMIGVSIMYFLTSICCFFIFLVIIALTSV
ncbi:DUF3667 domain-containing protein [Mucilaginibacter psychrotolerans]|uniref:DUF3667 domain-containing protein n=1 Tax=Mucilaginibacter psychrotolerans TaxID=1524096 RepID=A0A4Y8SJY0_9SPHI|nr:DUF3667 domain-containing protein [Mucilaginibacter psychrotolerans]TFF39218.1 DUF3667 domain-containing protein [Mucilaginibacter psychrotolerans]